MIKLIIVIQYDCPFNSIFFYFVVFMYVVQVFNFVHEFCLIAVILLPAIAFFRVWRYAPLYEINNIDLCHSELGRWSCKRVYKSSKWKH
jgi:hypothetical protein